MIKVIHRINTSKELQGIDPQYGVEVDIRAFGDRLILNHEPFQDGEDFETYLKSYHHRLLILNIKEAGIEDRVLALMKQFGITEYFLLDVEFPYIYRAARKGVKDIAIRYSEDESIETVLKYKGLLDWVWIDSNNKLPLDSSVIQKLQGFKTCLVCPERWGRPEDIPNYARKMSELGFTPTAVMTSLKFVHEWEKYETA